MQCKLQQSKFATFSSILHKHVDEKIKFLSFCLDREGGGKRITCGMEAGQS